MFKSLITGCLVVIAFLGMAQKEKDVSTKKEATNFYLTRHLGGLNYTIKDQAMSPMIYAGPSAHLGSGFEFGNSKYWNELEVSTNLGVIYPKSFLEDGGVFAGSFRFNLKYAYLFNINLKHEKLSFRVGPQWNNIFHMRANTAFSNSIMNYEALSAINVKSELNYVFDDGEYSVDYSLTLPVFALMLRPHYTLPFYVNPTFVSVTNFTFLDSEISLNKHLKNGNLIKFTYNWMYYGYNNLNRLQNASTLIRLTSMFKF